MKLVACPDCHAQYDVSNAATDSFACGCGHQLEIRAQTAVDAEIHRCASCGAHLGAAARSCDYCGAAVRRDTPRTLICPECYARNTSVSRFCEACGVAFQPQPMPSNQRELPCPACELGMPQRAIGDLPVWECGGCHGLWVPGEHFERLIERAAEARRKASASAAPVPRVSRGTPDSEQLRYRKCPECHGFMLRRNFRRSSGVILDVCRTHGTWLDADEIEEIAGFILAGGRPSAVLEEEHRRADWLASAARVRAGSEAASHSTVLGQPRAPSLLELLFDILT